MNKDDPPRSPRFLFLLAAYVFVCHGLGFVIALFMTVANPGEILTDSYLFEINILNFPTILPLGISGPIAAFAGYEILMNKPRGLFLLAFIQSMNLAANVILIIKYPGYIAATKNYNFPMMGCYGFLLISILIFWYLGSKIVRDYYGLELKYILKRYAVYLVIAFGLTFAIAFFADNIMGWESVKRGYVNPGWLK
jgi:hypothetical protein